MFSAAANPSFESGQGKDSKARSMRLAVRDTANNHVGSLEIALPLAKEDAEPTPSPNPAPSPAGK